MSEDELDDSLSISSASTCFEDKEDDTLWEVTEILAERGRNYKVNWFGVDENGKPWAPSWVPKHDVTDDLVLEWKRKKAQKKKKTKMSKGQDSTRRSTASGKASTSTRAGGSKAKDSVVTTSRHRESRSTSTDPKVKSTSRSSETSRPRSTTTKARSSSTPSRKRGRDEEHKDEARNNLPAISEEELEDFAPHRPSKRQRRLPSVEEVESNPSSMHSPSPKRSNALRPATRLPPSPSKAAFGPNQHFISGESESEASVGGSLPQIPRRNNAYVEIQSRTRTFLSPKSKGKGKGKAPQLSETESEDGVPPPPKERIRIGPPRPNPGRKYEPKSFTSARIHNQSPTPPLRRPKGPVLNYVVPAASGSRSKHSPQSPLSKPRSRKPEARKRTLHHPAHEEEESEEDQVREEEEEDQENFNGNTGSDSFLPARITTGTASRSAKAVKQPYKSLVKKFQAEEEEESTQYTQVPWPVLNEPDGLSGEDSFGVEHEQEENAEELGVSGLPQYPDDEHESDYADEISPFDGAAEAVAANLSPEVDSFNSEEIAPPVPTTFFPSPEPSSPRSPPPVTHVGIVPALGAASEDENVDFSVVPETVAGTQSIPDDVAVLVTASAHASRRTQEPRNNTFNKRRNRRDIHSPARHASLDDPKSSNQDTANELDGTESALPDDEVAEAEVEESQPSQEPPQPIPVAHHLLNSGLRVSKPLGPLPQISPSTFKHYVQSSNTSGPTSSIETFASPRKAVRPQSQEEETIEDWSGETSATGIRIQLRGAEIAEEELRKHRAERQKAHHTAPTNTRRSLADFLKLLPPTDSSQAPSQLPERHAEGEELMVQQLEDQYLDLSGGQGAGEAVNGFPEPDIHEENKNSLDADEPERDEINVGPVPFEKPIGMSVTMEAETEDKHLENTYDSLEAFPPTAANKSTNSQEEDQLPRTLHQALVLLNKRSEEISLLQAQLRQLNAEAEERQLTIDDQEFQNKRFQPFDGELMSLQAENARLQEQLSIIEPQLVTLTEEKQQLEQQHLTELMAREADLKAVQTQLADVTQDRNFYKQQFEVVQTFAEEARTDMATLKEAEALARIRLEDGLRMVHGTYEGQVRKLEGRIAELARLNLLLVEKDERTNDRVRANAARVPELENECETWKQRAYRAERQVETLEEQLEAAPDADYVDPSEQPAAPSSDDADIVSFPCNERDPLTKEVCFQIFDTQKELLRHYVEDHLKPRLDKNT